MGVEKIRGLISTLSTRTDADLALPGMPGVLVARVTEPTDPTPSVAKPLLAFTFQGSKRIALGERVHEQVPGSFLTVAVDLPIVGHYVEASRAVPYLGFGLELKTSLIAELLVEGASTTRGLNAPPPPGLAMHPATDEMLGAVERLLDLADRPVDAPILRPLVERELLWWVLRSPAGPMVRQIGLEDSSLTHIGRAIRHLRSNVFEPIQVPELAELSSMGVSSFHRQFRTVTEMSPLQYQKRLRLQEARLRLLRDPNDIAAVGHAVGYGSASQFSREYRREFGISPSADARRMRSADEVPA